MAARIPVLCLWAIAWLLGTGTGTRADELASYRAGDADIVLLTDPCGPKAGKIQRAHKRSNGGRLDGCWAVNGRGNPVVMWADGEVQELNESEVKLAPKYAAMVEDIDPPGATAGATSPARNFARPAWCPQARFPHERLVCRDQALAAADLRLAPVWRTYRTELKLNQVQQGRVKSDYFRRLKSCGAQKDCIAREQAAQLRFYREALARQ